MCRQTEEEVGPTIGLPIGNTVFGRYFFRVLSGTVMTARSKDHVGPRQGAIQLLNVNCPVAAWTPSGIKSDKRPRCPLREN